MSPDQKHDYPSALRAPLRVLRVSWNAETNWDPPPPRLSYDANGNVLNDNSHIYSWDAEGRPVSIDGVSLTYDALGRMVEQNRSSSYTELVYGPDGGKLALMNGQTVQKAFVPLPGKAAAVYNSTGLDHYRHPDWLGSSRFASTPSRGMYFDVAYAPFGEPYAQSGTTDLSFTGQNQDTVGAQEDACPPRHQASRGALFGGLSN